MSKTLIVIEFFRQVVRLEKTCKYRFVMLSSVINPPQFILKNFHCIFFYVRNVIEQTNHLDLFDVGVIELLVKS
ncbi:hypothetical protein D3C71_707200 [compost metagenome]